MSSSKSTSNKKLSKSEAMLTRHKSALLQRQLRSKDKNKELILKKSVTQLKTYQNKSSKKLKTQSPKNQEKESNQVITKELCPDKLKRNIKAKKVFLKPKHEMKLIRNKRKLGLPQKGGKDSICSRLLKKDPGSDLTIQELIHLTEDQSLDEEDFLEILTCESPVWWEDPHDDFYNEDAIYTRSPEIAVPPKHMNELSQSEDLNTVSTITIPVTKQSDDRFMKKRVKLENLLGNIKNKNVSLCKDKEKHCVQEKSKINEIAIVKKNSTNISIGNKNKENSQSIGYNSNSNNCSKNVDVGIVENNYEQNTKWESAECIKEDLFKHFQNDEMQESLENMYIPIKNDPEIMDDIIVIEDSHSEDSQKSDKNSLRSPSLNGELAELAYNPSEFLETCNTTITSITGESVEKYFLDDYTSSNIFTDKLDCSKLKTGPSFVITSIETDPTSSPITIKSEDSMDVVSLASDSDNIETISDTNIYFVEDESGTASPEECVENENKYRLKYKLKESFTTQISDPENENNFLTETLNLQKCNTSLIKNTRVKNVKEHTYIKPKLKSENCQYNSSETFVSSVQSDKSNHNTLNNKNETVNKTTLNISSEIKNAKYCLMCSSIFERNVCNYCENNTEMTNVDRQSCI